jgi:hypothetical protein
MITTPMSGRNAHRVIPAEWLDSARHAMERAPPLLDRIGWNRCHPRRASGQEPFNVRSVATAIAFIESGPVCRVSVPRLSSYALKHGAERWGDRVGFEPYVGNGDLILAARYCGVRLGKANDANCAIGLRYQEGG